MNLFQQNKSLETPCQSPHFVIDAAGGEIYQPKESKVLPIFHNWHKLSQLQSSQKCEPPMQNDQEFGQVNFVARQNMR